MILIALALLAGAGAPARTPSYAGDSLFARLDYGNAVQAYDSAERTSSDSAQYLWRLARAHVCRGDVSPPETRENEYLTALAYAERCIRADSMIAAGHTWKAAALGNLAMFRGSKAKVRLCNEIKEELDRALSLDSLDDVAYSIMGSFYLALGKVSWIERGLASVFLGSLPPGGLEDAERVLLKAIAIAPRIVRHRYELGLVYKEEGRTAEAIEEFTAATNLPTTVASDERSKKRAARLLETLKNE